MHKGNQRVYTDEERKQRHREASRRYWLANKEKHRGSVYRWKNKNQEKVREIDRAHFHRHPQKMYLKGVKYRAKNPQKVRQAQQLWAKRNPVKKRAIYHRYRARKVNAPGYNYTTAEHIEMRWQMFGCRCWVCGGEANHTDHVKPLDVGGSHYPANLRPICISCNSRKKNRWPIPAYAFLSVGVSTPQLSFIDLEAVVPEFTSPTPSPAVPPV